VALKPVLHRGTFKLQHQHHFFGRQDYQQPALPENLHRFILFGWQAYHQPVISENIQSRMSSPGMLRRVALARTDVSEELSASFIRVRRIGELGTTLAVTSNRRTLRRNTDVSEELSASFIRVTRIGELRTTLAVTRNGLAVRIPGCQPRSLGFDSRRYHIFCVAMGLERGPLSLERINELFQRKVAAPVHKSEINDRGGSAALTRRHPSIRNSWH
jgi:hypothetical protein